MPKRNFNKIALHFGMDGSPENLVHIFRTPFPKNTSGGLLLELLARNYQIRILLPLT